MALVPLAPLEEVRGTYGTAKCGAGPAYDLSLTGGVVRIAADIANFIILRKERLRSAPTAAAPVAGQPMVFDGPSGPTVAAPPGGSGAAAPVAMPSGYYGAPVCGVPPTGVPPGPPPHAFDAYALTRSFCDDWEDVRVDPVSGLYVSLGVYVGSAAELQGRGLKAAQPVII